METPKLSLYNTLTRAKELFEPINPPPAACVENAALNIAFKAGIIYSWLTQRI